MEAQAVEHALTVGGTDSFFSATNNINAFDSQDEKRANVLGAQFQGQRVARRTTTNGI
ncbi:hypothetical protein BGY98DRAFT_1104590 [Russula aff. rugulosa BPL654]|nr:hypothetical protein BGY98DRAFT_1104590 [Russula aff. rugulosa BPL654]